MGSRTRAIRDVGRWDLLLRLSFSTPSGTYPGLEGLLGLIHRSSLNRHWAALNSRRTAAEKILLQLVISHEFFIK